MKLSRILGLIIGFVFVPAAALLTVGILILVFGSRVRDYLFGGLVVAMVVTTVIGGIAAIVVLRREARMARLQTDFVNKVSHDLRTPLTSIRMFVETLQLGRLRDQPARQQEALEIIAEETERLSALINRLLDWARMESGRRTFDLHPEPLPPIVDAAVSALAPLRLHQPADVRVRVADGLPRVRVDRAALVEALVDVLTNAFKYTGPQKRIDVEASRAGPAVRIVIRDNGPGIGKQDLKKVFDRFYRARDPLDRIIEGSGLGLAMVKHIVTAHGGWVEAESELGKGTAFTITLPAIEEEKR
ncbi:MAG TPA: ATP-binding protein [Anaeromyxobacteraceae bacterium]|nr:ATP-binding protein [Anaeromyxobacteraceae bacterium]